MHNFQGHCWVQNRGERICRKKLLLELFSYRFSSNHFEENPFMHPDKKSPKNPQTDERTHNICKPFAIWLMIMSVQCTWYEERLYVDPYTRFC